jgi:aspartate ammonia-lyase
MPGKVNPVIPEVVNQIAFKVIGNDVAITMASEAGQLQLNVMEPVIIYALLESIDLLVNGIETLTEKCVVGITANKEVCRNLMLNSIGLVTALNPYIGYEKSTELAAEALRTGRGIYELVKEYNLLSQEELDDILRPENMIQPRTIAVI